MLTSSAKAKGRNLCKEVKESIHKAFPQLHNDDIQVTSSGAGGEDVKLSPKAREVLPISVECKATEAFNMRSAWEQAVANAKHYQPVVVHRKNHSKAVAICDLRYFISLHADCDRIAVKYIELQAAFDKLKITKKGNK